MENDIQGWKYILGIFHAAGIKLKLRLASWRKLDGNKVEFSINVTKAQIEFMLEISSF